MNSLELKQPVRAILSGTKMGLLRKALALGKVAVYRGSHPYRG
jgi:hypothetical protein